MLSSPLPLWFWRQVLVSTACFRTPIRAVPWSAGWACTPSALASAVIHPCPSRFSSTAAATGSAALACSNGHWWGFSSCAAPLWLFRIFDTSACNLRSPDPDSPVTTCTYEFNFLGRNAHFGSEWSFLWFLGQSWTCVDSPSCCVDLQVLLPCSFLQLDIAPSTFKFLGLGHWIDSSQLRISVWARSQCPRVCSSTFNSRDRVSSRSYWVFHTPTCTHRSPSPAQSNVLSTRESAPRSCWHWTIDASTLWCALVTPRSPETVARSRWSGRPQWTAGSILGSSSCSLAGSGCVICITREVLAQVVPVCQGVVDDRRGNKWAIDVAAAWVRSVSPVLKTYDWRRTDSRTPDVFIINQFKNKSYQSLDAAYSKNMPSITSSNIRSLIVGVAIYWVQL